MHTAAELYQNLLDDLQINTRLLTSDLDVETARKVCLAESFFKKYQGDKTADADRLCLDKFLVCNDSCRSFSLSPSRLFHENVINEVKLFFDDIFFCGPDLKMDLLEISKGFSLGPGANIDCKSYDFYTKLYNSSLTRTSDRLYREYRCALVQSRLLPAELKRSELCGDSKVVGSRLSFVPKTSEISRSICTEPTLNMLFQKGIGAFLEHELQRKTRINLSKQPILNRKLAKKGSIDGTYGTIDLSSASDSISIELCKQILPDYAFRWLMLARSPCTVIPDGTVVKLDMISSMGNGFTFPLQTLIFASLVVACYRTLGITPIYGSDGPQNFAVFGDDIIVRKDAYAFVIDCLALFGFKTNESKSFNTGYFRESCGGDFFKGHNVRGIYIKELKHELNVYSAINRIIKWSSLSGTFLPRVAQSLFESIPRHKRWVIPPADGDTEGIKVPYAFFKSYAPSYFTYLLERGASWPKIATAIGKKDRKGAFQLRSTGRSSKLGTMYLAFENRPKLYSLPFDDAETCKLPGFQYNGAGLLQAFCGGFIRNGKISVRSNEHNCPKVCRRFSSSWDWTPAADHTGRDFFWEYSAGFYAEYCYVKYKP